VDAVACLKELGGVDRVLATVPPAAMTDYLATMKFAGIMAYIGFAPVGKAGISLDANQFHVKRLQLRASFAAPALYLPRAVGLMREGFVDADALISRRFCLEETGEAMRALRDDKASAVKAVMVNG
jgi:L-iditol 2-dehydrogenase